MNSLDAAVEEAAGRLQHPGAVVLFEAVTSLGNGPILTAFTAGVAVCLLLLGRPRSALLIAAAVALSFLTTDLIKARVARERPDVGWRRLELPQSASFPSAHALESTAAYGVVGLVLARRLRRRALRFVVAGAGIGLGVLIGLSRVYLGVHYFTDVLAGWAVGLSLALAAAWGDRVWGGASAGTPVS